MVPFKEFMSGFVEHKCLHVDVDTFYGGKGKLVGGVSLNDFRAFEINADQWTPAAQNEGK